MAVSHGRFAWIPTRLPKMPADPTSNPKASTCFETVPFRDQAGVHVVRTWSLCFTFHLRNLLESGLSRHATSLHCSPTEWGPGSCGAGSALATNHPSFVCCSSVTEGTKEVLRKQHGHVWLNDCNVAQSESWRTLRPAVLPAAGDIFFGLCLERVNCTRTPAMAVVLGAHLPGVQRAVCTDRNLADMSNRSDSWFATPSEIHVLLVDDERLSRVVVGNLLKKCNYQVSVAESGGEALQMLRAAKPDTYQLVLTDVMMPDVGGLDLLRFVRTTDHLKNLPVVMMSANEHRETVFQCISGGAEEFLVKPVTKKEVQNIWQHVWRKLAHASASLSPADEDLAAPNMKTSSTNLQRTVPASGPIQQLDAGQVDMAGQTRGCVQPDHQQVAAGKRKAITLAQWMLRANRQVDIRDSLRLLCEVLLMFEQLAANCVSAFGLVRPSQLLLHASGKITPACEGLPTTKASCEEEALYCSPEEARGLPPSERSDTFSLGILLFELCHPASSQRVQTLSQVRLGLLPESFTDAHPQEASFILALLSPEPLDRPSPVELMSWDSLRPLCERLRLRHLHTQQHELEQQAAVREFVAAEDEALFEFLTMLRSSKHMEASALQAEIQCMEQDMAEVQRKLAVLTGSDLTASVSFWVEPELQGSARKRRRLGVTPAVEAAEEAMMRSRQEKIEQLYTQLETLYFERIQQHPKGQPQGPKRLSHSAEVETCRQLMRQRRAAHSGRPMPRNDSGDLSSVLSESSGTSQRSSVDSVPLAAHLSTFAEDLVRITQYKQFEVKASLRYGDLLSATNMVCSMAFDRDDEYFATAGVSKRIKIFDYSKVVDPHTSLPMQYPVLEINSRSKLSGVCFSSYIKGHLACSDYEGIVQLWDAHVNSELMQFEEHARRVWSVDLSRLDPLRLLSGSDDGSVKLWSMNQEHSVATIDTGANVCSVQFSPELPHLVAFGSANYRVYLYDLRNTSTPLAALPGHTKAVSYVRFMEGGRLVSASTDNTLRLWNIAAATSGAGATPPPEACHEMTFSGHVNEKNFVGLSVTDTGYIACGSESNSVHCYHRSLPSPLFSYALSSSDHIAGLDGDLLEGGQFVSSVCWSKKNNALLAANSAGTIRVLAMA